MIADGIHHLNQASQWLLSIIGKQVLYSGMIFCLVAAMTRLLRIRNPFWMLVLWAMVMWRMILSPSFSTPLALWSVLGKMLPYFIDANLPPVDPQEYIQFK